MVRDRRACDACARNCVTFHQKQKESSPLITRFWKVVLDEEYSNVLYLPPKFSRTVKLVAGQETQIEDSNGQQWTVTLSNVNRSLAFQEGWNEFFVDHGLGVGDLLVFNYVRGSHFVVQIYGKSSCERINFNTEKSRGREKLKRDSGKVSVDEPSLNVSRERKRPKRDMREGFVDKPSLDVASGSKCQNRQTHQVDEPSLSASQERQRLKRDLREVFVNKPFRDVASGSKCQNCQTHQVDEPSLNASQERKRLNRDLREVFVDKPFLDVASGSECQNRQTHQVEAVANLTRRVSMDMEDPTCLINRDDEYHRSADRNVLFDLSSLEMKKDTFETNKFVEALDMQIMPCLDETTEQGAKVDDLQMDATHTNEIDGHCDDVLPDKSKEAVDSIPALPHAEKVDLMDMDQNAEAFMDEVDKVVETIIASSHTEKVALADMNRNAEVSVDWVETVVETKIVPPRTENVAAKDVNQNAEVSVDEVANVVNSIIAPPCTEIKEQMKAKKDETEMTAIGTENVAGKDVNQNAGVFMDKVVNVVNTKIAPPRAEIKEQMKAKKDETGMTAIGTENVAGKDVNQNAEVSIDKIVNVVNTKIAPPRTEINEQMKTKKDETEMTAIGTTPVADRSAHLFTDKSRFKPFDRIELSKKEICNNSNSEPPHSEIKEQMKTKKDETEMTAIGPTPVADRSAHLFTEKSRIKPFDRIDWSKKEICNNSNSEPPHSEIKEQMKTKKDETEMTAIGLTPGADRSAHLFTVKSDIKSFGRIDLSKKKIYNNSNSRSGNNNVQQTNSGTPSISSGKIERRYTLRSRYPEAVPRSAVKGKVPIKKEPVEFEEQANHNAGVSSGKEPTSPRKRGRPVVKAEPYDTDTSDAASHFSAKVENQDYLELPTKLPSIPGRRRRRGKVVYLEDPVGRIWPLLYHEEFPVKALTATWSIFCEENGIKLGDKCRFQAENEINSLYSLYRVDIIRSF